MQTGKLFDGLSRTFSYVVQHWVFRRS